MTGGDAQMRADIASYGWHVIKVYGDDEGPAFAFTIGLFQRFWAPANAWIQNAQPVLADH